MDAAKIAELLKKSGYIVENFDAAAITLEDPACIIRSFQDFIDFAGIAISTLAVILLFGWGIALIRGADVDITKNVRNLFLLFGGLATIPFLVSFMLGRGLFSCRYLTISVPDINNVLAMKDHNFGGAYVNSMVVGETTQTFASVSVSPDMSNANDDVIYTDAAGNRIIRRGGSRAWRNNNPGNIRDSKFTRDAGAIGAAGGFAVFPDEATGARAMAALLRSDNYRILTINGVINRYSPPSENHTAAYQAAVAQRTGLSGNRRMSSLSPQEFQSVVNAMRIHEGWTPGRIITQ